MERLNLTSRSPARTSVQPKVHSLACALISKRSFGRHSRVTARPKCVAYEDSAAALGEDLCWRADFSRHYVKGKLIGTGSFGCVYLGIDLHSGQEVAVKVMPKVRGKLTKERTLEKLQKEVDIIELLQPCKNVVRLENCFETDNEVMVVTEFCAGGDLQKLSDTYGALSERCVALVAQEVLKVVKTCHEAGHLHGDLKPANFVLKYKSKQNLAEVAGQHASWLKAIDFGCSQSFQGARRLTKRTGTPVYMAPEIFLRDYSAEADLWSLGVMLYQLLSRRFPFWETEGGCKATSIEEVQKAVLDNDIQYNYGAWLQCSDEGLDFIQRCLERDFQSRITVAQALEHPWIVRHQEKTAPCRNNIVPSLSLVPKVSPLAV